MLDIGCWILDAGYWMLDARCSMLDAGTRMLVFIPRLKLFIFRSGFFIFTSSHILIFTSSHLHIFTSSYFQSSGFSPFRPKGITTSEGDFGADGGRAVPSFYHNFATNAAFFYLHIITFSHLHIFSLPAFPLSVRRGIQSVKGISARTGESCTKFLP
jgi:hypothetical protein